MIKHCQKFHFRIFRHGFLISKHVRAGRHGILAPGSKPKHQYINFCYLICRRVGLSASSLSASWFVGELDCRRVGVSASWFVGELVCRRVGLSASCPVTEHSRGFWTIVHWINLYPHQLYSFLINLHRVLHNSNFGSLMLTNPYIYILYQLQK